MVAAGAGKGLYPIPGYSFKNTIGSTFFSVGYLIFMGFSMYIAVEVQRAGQRRRQLSTMLGGGLVQVLFLLISLFAFYHSVGENFAISAAAGNQVRRRSGGGVPVLRRARDRQPRHRDHHRGRVHAVDNPPINLFIIIMQRCIFAWSFERLLPPAVSKVSSRTHTPLVAILISAILAIIGLGFSAYNAHFSTALTLATFPSFVMILVLGIAAVSMPYRRRSAVRGLSR